MVSRIDESDWFVNGESHEFGEAVAKINKMVVDGVLYADILEFFRDKMALEHRREVTLIEAAIYLQIFNSTERVTLGVQDPSLGVQDSSQGQDDERGFVQDISFYWAAFVISFKSRLLQHCPALTGKFCGSYTPLVGGDEISLSMVFILLGNSENIMSSEVVHRVESIRENRNSDPQFLLDDDEMERLRMVVFLFNSLNLKRSMFCEFGKKILDDLILFVSEYEGNNK